MRHFLPHVAVLVLALLPAATTSRIGNGDLPAPTPRVELDGPKDSIMQLAADSLATAGDTTAARAFRERLVGDLGDTVTFTALAIDAIGRRVPRAKFRWSAPDSSVLRLISPGQAACIEHGSARITAYWLRTDRRPVADTALVDCRGEGVRMVYLRADGTIGSDLDACDLLIVGAGARFVVSTTWGNRWNITLAPDSVMLPRSAEPIKAFTLTAFCLPAAGVRVATFDSKGKVVKEIR